MVNIGIEDGELAKQILAIYVMASPEYWDCLNRIVFEDGLLALAGVVSELSRRQDAKIAVREDGLSNDCIEFIERLEKAVANLHAFVVSE